MSKDQYRTMREEVIRMQLWAAQAPEANKDLLLHLHRVRIELERKMV